MSLRELAVSSLSKKQTTGLFVYLCIRIWVFALVYLYLCICIDGIAFKGINCTNSITVQLDQVHLACRTQ